jgi:hypothetical protein
VNSGPPFPIIREFPAGVAADLFSAVNLSTCPTRSSPAHSYQWYKDGADIPGERGAYLLIEEAVPEDRGNYTCVAINAGVREESQPTRLIISG